jgi:hypothetical protein
VIVGLLSTYREGPLARGAVDSALRACDRVFVFEGPAGPRLPNEHECPPTEIADPEFGFDLSDELLVPEWDLYFRNGEWKTDAKKRTAMIEATRGLEPPVWGVWIDGDEILMNGEYLRDWTNALEWADQGKTFDPDDESTMPYMGFPIKLVELDGSITVCQGKVLRVDLIDQYSVSSSVFRNVLGMLEARGNLPLRVNDWVDAHAAAINSGTMVMPPPLPCEPFLLHRSFLRHPARRGLRLHEQEAVEIAKARARDGERTPSGAPGSPAPAPSDRREAVILGADGKPAASAT